MAECRGENGACDEAVGAEGSVLEDMRSADAGYDLQVAEFFRCNNEAFLRRFMRTAQERGMRDADAEDIYQDYVLSVLGRRNLDFSRNPEAYLFAGMGKSIMYSNIHRWRKNVRRQVAGVVFWRDWLEDASLDPRISAEQEGKFITVEAMECLRTVVARIFKRMSFIDACIFFLYYVCECSSEFIAKIFDKNLSFVRFSLNRCYSSFIDQIMRCEYSEVNQLIPFDFSVFDGPVIDVIRKVLLERADFREGHRDDPVDYSLLSSILESSFDEFMRIIDANRVSGERWIGRARLNVKSLFEAALVED